MKKLLIIIFSMICVEAISAQSIRVNPTGVNVNSQNSSVVFLTFGQIPADYVPAEAVWCGELIPATSPALGLECRPDTIYGAPPARYDRRQSTGNGGLTDIMAIPPSVVRRAYQAAARGAGAAFFYVRRFVSRSGQPDQFVNVTCRMTGGGARVPFALTDVEIRTDRRDPILFIKSGEKLPNVVAEIQYNGTGRLKGRWEIVQPGEEPPTEFDLLTEATLSTEQRGSQKRFTQIARFNHFLPPAGKFSLPLEINENAPFIAEGQYILLLRIEATDDKEGDSDLRELGVGDVVVHSGAVSAFPMPALKFFVGGKAENTFWESSALILPLRDSFIEASQPLVFSWRELVGAAIYRLEIFDRQETRVLSALVLSPTANYRAPTWFQERFGAKNLSWRIVAHDANGKIITQTIKQPLKFRGKF